MLTVKVTLLTSTKFKAALKELVIHIANCSCQEFILGLTSTLRLL